MSKRRARKNLIILLLVFGIGVGFIYGQENEADEDPLLTAFLENFRRATDETKLDILNDSVNYATEEMGPLYKRAVDYVINNSDRLQSTVALQKIALLGAQLAGLSGYTEASGSLWELFEIYNDAGVRLAILDALRPAKLGNERSLQRINQWMQRQVSIFRGGGGVDTQAISYAIDVVGDFNDPASFPVLLSLSVLGLSNEIKEAAEEALVNIEGDYSAMAEEVIREYPAAEKLVALKTAVNREQASNEEIATVAISALEVANGLTLSDRESASTIREMRILAANVLGRLGRAEATPHLIDHFDLCVLEMDRGIGTKSALLEAIAALGAMGTREAAVRLALYLDVINSFVESNQGYDEQITLAVVHNLGELKSKVGLNALLYLGYLEYSKRIREAGEEARREILGR